MLLQNLIWVVGFSQLPSTVWPSGGVDLLCLDGCQVPVFVAVSGLDEWSHALRWFWGGPSQYCVVGYILMTEGTVLRSRWR